MRLRNISLLVLIGLFFTANSYAQQYRPDNTAKIFKQLQQLERIGTVMYIAAHPDDENTRLITYLINHDHINTIYLSLTRGDGGQNILGNEQGAALGLIRTNEMMMARKIDGASQLFTRFIDFGYTKSPVETFEFWNKEKVVDDIKYAIQQYHPDILICRFPTTGEGGHGQHTASAIAALEAFNQLQNSKDKSVWKPKRILFNAFKFGSSNTIKEGQFELPINQYDPILGEAYGEIAGRSRSEHKSQGAGTPQSFGVYNEHFELMAGAPLSKSLYDGIDTNWSRVNMPEIGTAIQNVISNFNFNQPSASIPALIKIKKQLENNKEKNSFWIKEKIEALNHIIIDCSGFQMEILANEANAIRDQKIDLNINAACRTEGTEVASILDLEGKNLFQNVALNNDQIWKEKISVYIPKNTEITQAYWLIDESKNNQFVYPAPYHNEPLSENHLVLPVNLKIDGTDFEIKVPISYKKLDPTRGDIIEALKIMPDVDVAPTSNMRFIAPGEGFMATVHLSARKTIENARLEILDDKGKLIAQKSGINLQENKAQLETISIASSDLPAKNKYILYRLVLGDKTYQKQLHEIDYPHIPKLQYFTDAITNIVAANWKNNVQNVGYIAGAGDKVAEVLSELAMNVTMLGETELSDVKQLSKYDAIVCGVRMANTRKDLLKYMPNLWQYVSEGGTVVEQYNTSAGIVNPDFSPLPISLSRDRVTDEKAKVSIIDKNALVLTAPNKIKDTDFDDWIQERGIYFPSTWDKNYKTVLSMHDKGEQPLESGILYTKFGKGYFAYSSLVFFRELPIGNEGAIKLFINLLNLGK